ncbi:hypothetical protein H2199_005206 [Coniosporium tulheliwenetii]|uniref:Uncharacterized protein n=1 Tax=Coniosporium tulheliwenetii TaxID=3383036 RepID=A0ACC2Z2V0_9PEZI|nr:hypothetical protein H2199_005206 [Cladosporium sp. JES 115]
MSSYLTSLYTTTTSRYASLRRNLLSSEEDGDTEDDSHISRVLRAYYTEKGRPFPPWLPPDPKAPKLNRRRRQLLAGKGAWAEAAAEPEGRESPIPVLRPAATVGESLPSSVKRVWDNGAGEAQSEIVGQCEVGESDWEFKYTRDGERREQSRVESGWIEKSP